MDFPDDPRIKRLEDEVKSLEAHIKILEDKQFLLITTAEVKLK